MLTTRNGENFRTPMTPPCKRRMTSSFLFVSLLHQSKVLCAHRLGLLWAPASDSLAHWFHTGNYISHHLSFLIGKEDCKVQREGSPYDLGKFYRWKKVVVCAVLFHLPRRSIKLLGSPMESQGPSVPTFTPVEKLRASFPL